MISLLAIFASQFAFQYFRAISVRTTAAKHVPYTLVFTNIIQALWLVSTYLGVTALQNADWLLVTAYMLGGTLGTYFSFKILKHI